MVMVFIVFEFSWKCKNNFICYYIKSISIRDGNDYKFRCNIFRVDWEYVDDFIFVVIEVCKEVFIEK